MLFPPQKKEREKRQIKMVQKVELKKQACIYIKLYIFAAMWTKKIDKISFNGLTLY